MQYTLALLALAASVIATPAPQGVTADITPASTAPAGCQPTFSGNFVITIQNVTTNAKRDTEIEKRVTSCGGPGTLIQTLADGIIHDSKGRTGYIASNGQFQFDGPPQAGAIYTGGFSICGNNSLALGGSTIFYQCLSGTFYNLYDISTGAQCSPVYINAVSCIDTNSGASSSSTTAAATSTTTSSTSTSITPSSTSTTSTSSTTTSIVTTSVIVPPVSANATISITTMSATAPITTLPVITQISDGQPQASTVVSASPSIATAGAGNIYTVGKGLVAIAAGAAGLVMI
ncbi:hypothetical protein MMC19_000561 [Ptychographa xylographoides]|nr:hypothetical protein [Ptychographa xylographoides]